MKLIDELRAAVPKAGPVPEELLTEVQQLLRDNAAKGSLYLDLGVTGAWESKYGKSALLGLFQWFVVEGFTLEISYMTHCPTLPQGYTVSW